LRDPLGAGYVRARLAAAKPETHGVIWASWLRAQSAIAANADAEAEASVRQILAQAKDFGPAWDLLEKLARRAKKSPNEIDALRSRRLAALGADSGTESERLVDRARSLHQRKELQTALDVARAASKQDPTSIDAAELVGDLSAELGDDKAACLSYRTALRIAANAAGASSETRSSLPQKLLAALERARGTEPPVFTRAEIADLLAALEKSLPDDPRIVIEAAKDDLTYDTNNPALNVTRAYARLEGFRALHKGIPLERLASGSVQHGPTS